MKTTNHAKTINGKPVVNGARRVKLHISPLDTKSAAKKDHAACAAALAALRDVPNCVAARVHLGRAYLLKKDGQWHRYKVPAALRTEIVSFDRGGGFEPGEYELIPMSASDLEPKKVKTFVSSSTNRSIPGGSPTKNPRKLRVTKGVRTTARNAVYA
jgi:hypothetical protein